MDPIWDDNLNLGVTSLKSDIRDFDRKYGDIVQFTGEASIGTSGPDASLKWTVDWSKLKDGLDKTSIEDELQTLENGCNALKADLGDLKTRAIASRWGLWETWESETLVGLPHFRPRFRSFPQ